MTFRNKNIKTIKTIVFAAIILTLVIPMAEIKMVEAKLPGRDIASNKPSYTEIPLQQDLRNQLMTKLQAADSESSKKEIESELGKIDTSVQQWFKDHTDSEKEKLESEKQKILVDAWATYEAKYGFKNATQYLPWSTMAYDYVDNALEVTILPEYFTPDAIPQHFEKIRSIVGNEIDIRLSPLDYTMPTGCASRTSPCNPLTGGIQYGPSGCSTGYAATYQTWTGFVTAGHCVVGAGSITQPVGGSVIGQQQADTFYAGSNCDCAYISATIAVDNKIFGYSTTPNNTAPPFVGMTVTMSGVGTNGLSSGTVTATNVDEIESGTLLHQSVRASYTSIGGDSGAPVVSGTAIVGIQHSNDVNNNSYFSTEGNVRSNLPGLAWKFTYPP